ncbi:MAG: hypothetical protein EOO46_13085 [Flavobacterium sp.]|nr:MAG: hypothetical protein EOO46_13085 [Flavobacterium sp.]
MEVGEIVFYLVLFLIIAHFIIKLFQPSKDEIEYRKKLKERLSDEFLYDPTTGAKFTLEQAEKGYWIENDNEERIKNPEELNLYYEESEKTIEDISNFLKSEKMILTKLSSAQTEILNRTITLSKYSSWNYWNCFTLEEGKLVFFPQIHIDAKFSASASFSGYQIMFWIKTQNINGHYFLRQKTMEEQLVRLFRRDQPFIIDNYEVETLSKSSSISNVVALIKPFEHLKNIEIEIHDEDLFIKTNDEPTLEGFYTILRIIRNDC